MKTKQINKQRRQERELDIAICDCDFDVLCSDDILDEIAMAEIMDDDE